MLHYVSLGYYERPSIDYYTKVYVTPSPSITPTQRRLEVFCAVFRNLTAVLTEAQRHCVNRTVYEEFNIRFESDEIAFEIDEKNLSDWKIIRTHIPSTVLKASVDSYDGSVCPPHCTFRVTWMGGDREPDVTEILLKLVGTKRPHCCNIELPVKYIVTDHTTISDVHIHEISLFLVRWEDVAHQLNVDRLEIDEIQQAPRLSAVARNREVLMAWKRAMPGSATYGRLVEVLSKLKEVECAERVCKLIR